MRRRHRSGPPLAPDDFRDLAEHAPGVALGILWAISAAHHGATFGIAAVSYEAVVGFVRRYLDRRWW